MVISCQDQYVHGHGYYVYGCFFYLLASHTFEARGFVRISILYIYIYIPDMYNTLW